MDIRAVAYQPGGDRLGVLADTLEMTLTVPRAETPTLALSYPSGDIGVRAGLLDGEVEVAIEATHNGTTWTEVPGGRFISQKTETDLLDDGTRARKLDAVHISTILSEALVWDVPEEARDKDGKWNFLSANAGLILRTLWDAATARGWGQGLTLECTTTTDTAGARWASVVTLAFEDTITLAQVVESLTNLGLIDTVWVGRTMRVYNADTTLAADRPGVIWPLHAGSTTAASEATTWADLCTDVLIKGEGEAIWRVHNDKAPTGTRRIEKVVEAGGVETEATARLVAAATLASGAEPAREIKREWHATGALLLPWRDYAPGDWIRVERAGGLERLRVAQVSVTRNADGISGHTTFGTRLDDVLSRLAKKTKGIVGGASTSGSGVRPAPSGQDKRTPAKVQGLVVEADSVELDDGRTVGVLDATWGAVSTATDSTALEVAGYDIAARRNVEGAPWRTMDTSEDTTSHLEGWRVADQVAVRVRARGRYATAPGIWSDQVIVTIPKPAPLDPPTTLTGRVNNGMVTLEWDGRLQAPGGGTYTPPRRFSHLIIQEAQGTSGPWVQVGTIQAGTLTLDRQDLIGSTRYYQATAVDWRGVTSAPSGITEVTITSEVMEQIQAATARVNEAEADMAKAKQDAQEALAATSKISDIERQAAEAWNKAVAAGTAADLALQGENLAGEWTAKWWAGADITKTADQMEVRNNIGRGQGAATSSRFGCVSIPAQAQRTGRVYRFELVVSSTADGWISQGMYMEDATATYVRSYSPEGNNHDLNAGDDRRLITVDFAPQFTDETPRGKFISYVAAGGGTVTIHSARVIDVTDVSRAQATADGKNTITRSTMSAYGQGKTVGDVWWRYSSSSLSGPIIGQWTWDGTTWQPSTIDSQVIDSLTADKLRAAVGSLDLGYVKSLISDSGFISQIYSQRVVVASDNLIPDPFYDLGDVGIHTGKPIVSNGVSMPGHTHSMKMAQQPAGSRNMSVYGGATWGNKLIPVTPGETLRARTWWYVTATPPNSGNGLSTQVYFYDANKAMLSSGGNQVSWPRVANADITPRQWVVTGGSIITVPDGAAYCVVVPTWYFNPGTTPNNAVAYVGHVELKSGVGSTLIEPGAITTDHLYVTSDMTAKIAQFLKVKAGMIESGAVTAETIAAGALDAKTINSAIINGSTITGSLIRTATSGTRLELGRGDDLTGYDSNGVRRVHMDGSTITLHSTDGGEAFRLYADKDSSGWYQTTFKSSISQGKMSYLRAGRTVYDGVDSAYMQMRIVGTDWSQGNSPHITLYGEGAFYLGGARGSVQMRNSTGELRLYSSAGLIGLYGLPTTGSTGSPLTLIQGASGMWSVYRNTSLASAKVGIADLSETVDDPYAVLAVRERTFQDRTWSEHYLAGLEAAQQRREGLTPPERLAQWEGTTAPPTLVGVIAEEVQATGLPGLCSYDETGALTGVQYDRLAVYLLAALRALKTDHDRLTETVNELTKENNS